MESFVVANVSDDSSLLEPFFDLILWPRTAVNVYLASTTVTLDIFRHDNVIGGAFRSEG